MDEFILDFCGYCIHYRAEDDGKELTECCALDSNINCHYSHTACESFEPDQKYIDFLKGE